MATIPVTPDMLDKHTPPEVNITTEAHAPYMDPTLGIAVKPKFDGNPSNRLVTIGDSLTHGFQSGAIYNTGLSYPAIVAYELGSLSSFRFPTYPGFGGLPINIEFIIRQLEKEFGDKIDWWEIPLAGFRGEHLLAEIEDWWERGPGSIVPKRSQIMHNLGIYGWDLRDILSRSTAVELNDIHTPKENGWFQLVENANERAALRVLPPLSLDGNSLTPLQSAEALGAEGSVEQPGQGEGIETLVVMIGANNVLPSVVKLQVKWSEEGYQDLHRKQDFTVWNPKHFADELAHVITEMKKIRARHVILSTVPHVTIAPITRGVSNLRFNGESRKVRPGSRYFPFYTRPWISDTDFNPNFHPNITEQQARAIDSAIDQYNEAIASAVKSAREEGRDWYLFDMCGMLDRLASRRYIEDPAARPFWWENVGGAYPLPDELKKLSPDIDSHFFTSGASGRIQGGIFALDGVHPTTVGYGLIAQEIINIQRLAGVTFRQPDGITERVEPVGVDYNRLIARDTLISDPPRSLSSDLKLIGWLDTRFEYFAKLFNHGS